MTVRICLTLGCRDTTNSGVTQKGGYNKVATSHDPSQSVNLFSYAKIIAHTYVRE